MTPAERAALAEEYQRLTFKLEAVGWRLTALARDLEKLQRAARETVAHVESMQPAPTKLGPFGGPRKARPR